MADQLVDTFGRVHRDLRISVTDRCNFRCAYCMPAEGLDWMPREDLLTFEEITRTARIMVERYGVTGIRLTGGEPTVRANLPELVGMLSALGADLALTTNGVTLPLLAETLRAAGLNRVNVSCDSLRQDRFADLTRRDDLTRVLEGIDAAVAAGFDPVKVNCVVMRGVNDDEVADFVEFGRSKGVEVRFIEFMPLDADGIWSNDSVVPVEEILALVEAAGPVTPVRRTSAPATRYRFDDGSGTVGIVASVSDSFCATCDRVRLTADGQFRNCLFAVSETDLRALLRSGAGDDEIAAALERSVASKWAGHQINRVHFVRPHRSMSQIGG
ncbi:MAG: GTP 3',8-cyclase MoaA [Acidimicrobiaceae bacterium]|nr:GTP 3',8-cyclase MoaA [Acidimicrobiaceae bacterium]MCY4175324.1 GTP 3',8-cyclase MoaA [Acidimicrobiaceae bacterium]MCY4280632.1 GTP 3',8-cyclase MoaA [Acidimicrobiaceae bacterium]MCY4293408.1 GTP 3',8-cyclase MoaA [Acidimicrobiaceae bacterium]